MSYHILFVLFWLNILALITLYIVAKTFHTVFAVTGGICLFPIILKLYIKGFKDILEILARIFILVVFGTIIFSYYNLYNNSRIFERKNLGRRKESV